MVLDELVLNPRALSVGPFVIAVPESLVDVVLIELLVFIPLDIEVVTM